jgi:hypothetical protein
MCVCVCVCVCVCAFVLLSLHVTRKKGLFKWLLLLITSTVSSEPSYCLLALLFLISLFFILCVRDVLKDKKTSKALPVTGHEGL